MISSKKNSKRASSSKNPESRNYLVCYDITIPKNLKKIHKLCLNFGVPLQYSVFWCKLTSEDLQILSDRLKPLVGKDDQVLFFKLQESRNGRLSPKWIQALGRKPNTNTASFWILD